MVTWKIASVVVVVGAVSVVAGCSRSAPPRQAAEPVPDPSHDGSGATATATATSATPTSTEARAALVALEAKIRERDSSIPVVTEETVERYGQTLLQYRISAPSTRLPAGIGSPTLVMYTPIEDRAGSSAAAQAIMDTLANAMELVPGLMSHGQIAVEPVVAYFAVKPGHKARAWVSGLVHPLLIHDRDRLIHDLGAIAVPEIQRLIVIGIVFPADGQSVNAFDLPMPRDWMAAKAQASKPMTFPEELFAIVWPD